MPYPSSVAAIETRVTSLATTYSAICTRVECPHKTYEGGTAAAPGRTVAYLKIGTGTGEGRPRILIVAGMHAREWAPPDAVLTFVEKLLEAYTKGKPIAYDKFVDTRNPAQTITYKRFVIPFDPNVKQIIERTELYVLPLANPDGRAYTMPPTKVIGWRKNRRPAVPGASCPPLPAWLTPDDLKFVSNDPAGVDLNRNFDIAWDFQSYFSNATQTAATTRGSGVSIGTSADFCELGQTFHGPAGPPRTPEPETQNIQELIAANKANFYVDVHSAAGKLLYAWGMASNQENDPAKTFKNTALDQASGGTGRTVNGSPPPYAEWMPPGMEGNHRRLGDLIRDAILDSTGYSAGDSSTVAVAARSASLYPAVQSINQFSGKLDFSTGVSRDFAFSQQIGSNPGSPITAKALDPVFSYTFECGRDSDGKFWPDPKKEYPKIEREVGMGLATLLSYAANWHAPVLPPPPPPTPPPPPPSSSGGGWCSMTAVYLGEPLHPQLQFLRNLRDLEFKATPFGCRFLKPIEAVYWKFSPAIAPHLRQHPLLRKSVRTFLASPAVRMMVLMFKACSHLRSHEQRVRWLAGSLCAAGLGALGAICALVMLSARALLK
jgi:hypothetical protein